MGALGLKYPEPLDDGLSCSSLNGNLLRCGDVLTAPLLESFCVGSGFRASQGYRVDVGWKATTLPSCEAGGGT